MARKEVYAVLLGCLFSLLVCEATYFRRTVYKPVLWRKHRPMTSPSRWNFSLHRGLNVKPYHTWHVRQYHGTIRNKMNGTHSRNTVKVRKHKLNIRFINICRHKFGRFSSSTIYRFTKRNSHILPFVFKNIAPKYKRERKTWYILKQLCACYRNICNSTVGGEASSTVRTTPQTLVTEKRVNTTSSTPKPTQISSTYPKSSTITSTNTPVKPVTSRKTASTTSHQSTSSGTTTAKPVTSVKPVTSTTTSIKPVTSTTTSIKPVTSTKSTSSTKSSTTKPSMSSSTNPFIPIVPDPV